MKNKLTEKEKMFCVYYAQGGDARGAAAASGYNFPKRAGAKLLARKDISEEITRLEKEKSSVSASVEKGLMRLAFGSVTDAVRLMLSENELSPDEIERLDLFNVSDIKKPKGGGVEIKFFDRLKALEKLSQLSDDVSGTENAFVKALAQGAKLLAEEDDENG